jgi:hypothetical protein
MGVSGELEGTGKMDGARPRQAGFGMRIDAIRTPRGFRLL